MRLQRVMNQAGASTQQETVWAAELLRVTRPCLLAVGMIAAGGWTATAMAQTAQITDGSGSNADQAVQASVLKALATAPELASESITASTAGGIVTLSGSVTTERARTRAENIAANTAGVRKVVDELQLTSAQAQTPASGQPNAPAGSVLLSDGTYGQAPMANDGQSTTQAPPANGQRNDPDADAALDQQMDQQRNPQYGQQTPNGQTAGGQYPQQQPAPSSQTNNGYPQQQGYPQANNGYPQQQGYPQANNGYPQQQGGNGYPQGAPNGYPQRAPYGYPQQQGSYPQQQGNYPQQQPGYSQPYPQQGGYPAARNGQPRQVWGGQQPGEAVLVPTGVMLRVRINRLLASNKTQPGTPFDGIVLNDITADGFVAIPRGAAVQGTVVDAKGSGALSGRGELSIQLTQVTLGGKVYPIVSDLWAHNGGDKTIETINRTAGFGALGAIIGAVGGGGVGAAVGGGVGAAAGVASSASDRRGQVVIPPEGVVVFHLAQPVELKTVSEQEMERLGYGVAPGADPRLERRYPASPGYYPYGAPAPAPYGYPNQ